MKTSTKTAANFSENLTNDQASTLEILGYLFLLRRYQGLTKTDLAKCVDLKIAKPFLTECVTGRNKKGVKLAEDFRDLAEVNMQLAKLMDPSYNVAGF